MVYWVLFFLLGAAVAAVLAFWGTSMVTAEISMYAFIAFVILVVGSVLGVLFGRGRKPHTR